MSIELQFKIEGEEGVTPDYSVTCDADYNRTDEKQLGNGISIDNIDVRDPYDTKIHPADLPEDTRKWLYEEAEALARQAFGRAY